MTRIGIFKGSRHVPARPARAAVIASPEVAFFDQGLSGPFSAAEYPQEAWGLMSAAIAEQEMPRGMGDDDLHRGYWLTHMRIGFGVFLGESLVVLAYLGLTPHGPHRPLLMVVATAWLVFAAANLALTATVASRSWRAMFSVCWTILSAFAVVGVCDLDRGIRSPMLFLLFLPISFAAWAFTPRAAAACGVSSLASLGLVIMTTQVTGNSYDIALMLCAVLAGSSVLSVAAARNRKRREQYESLLVQKITEMATTDGLTGCAVHRVFHQRVREEVARSKRHGYCLSLLMIDLDNFKGINDTFGHVVGDNVLAGVGAGLREHSRASDLVARLGGDEFAVILPDTKPSDAAVLAERIRREIPPTLEVPVTLSVGVSGLDPSTPTAEQLLDDADFALYEVKRTGRDSVAVRYPGHPTATDPPDPG